MNCPACGHENPDRAKFCLECGAGFAARCARCDTELPARAKFCLECGAAVATGESPAPDRTPRDYTPRHLADKILQSKSALERGVAVNVAAGRVVRFIPALNIPEDDLGEAVDIVLDLVAD